MEAHTCNHPKVPHQVHWLMDEGKALIPMVGEFGDLEAADIFAQKIIRQNTDRLTWIKIVRTDNPTYTCFLWMNHKKADNMQLEKVKLEVDMEPLKSTFDNVALGFKNHGKAIKRLMIGQAITSTLALGLLIERLF